MGCCSSKGNAPGSVQATHCQLSVDNDAGGAGESQKAVVEDLVQLVAELDQQTIIDMLAAGDGRVDRKMNIGSTTDESKVSFASKSIKHDGDDLKSDKQFWGYSCRKGLKPGSPNQDSWSILKVEGGYSIYAVFDGHGKKGHDVSNYVKEILPKLIIKDARFRTNDMNTMLVDIFKKTQSLVSTADCMQKLSAQLSGTTATVVIHDINANKLTVSHVADSSAVLGKFYNSDRKILEAVSLTRDHKPNLKDEKTRIESSGGRIVFDGFANYRIYAQNARYPGLNLSRAIGDLLGHADCGIIAEPEVSTRAVSKEDYILLVCSDGVWEFITPMEAVNIVTGYTPDNAMVAAEALAKEAWDRWITEEGGVVVDDITVVLVFLNPDDEASNNSASVSVTNK